MGVGPSYRHNEQPPTPRVPRLSLAEREVLALERIALADEHRNRLLIAESIDRRATWAESQANSKRMLELAEEGRPVAIDEEWVHKHAADPLECPPGCERRVGAEQFRSQHLEPITEQLDRLTAAVEALPGPVVKAQALGMRPSRLGRVLNWTALSDHDFVDLTVRIEDRSGLYLRTGERAEVIFLDAS